MNSRIDYKQTNPDGVKAMWGLENYIHHCGLEASLLELFKTRASQINGCAYAAHTRDCAMYPTAPIGWR